MRGPLFAFLQGHLPSGGGVAKVLLWYLVALDSAFDLESSLISGIYFIVIIIIISPPLPSPSPVSWDKDVTPSKMFCR